MDSSSSAWKARVVFWFARPLDRLGIELEKWSEESDIK